VTPEETAQEKIDAETENQAVEKIVDPTAEEAERTAAQLNNAPQGDEEKPADAAPAKEAEEDPRAAIAARHAARQRERSKEWTGRMTDPTVIAGAGPVEKALEEPEQPAAPVQEPSQPQRVIKVKVDGNEYEVPQAQVDAAGGIAPFQTMAAAQRRLNEANQQLEYARRVRAEAEQFATMRATPAPTNAETRPPTASPQPTGKSAAATDPLASLSEEELAEVVNKLQMGSTEEAVNALRQFGNRIAAPQQAPLDIAEAIRSGIALDKETEKAKGSVQDFANKYHLADFPEAQLLVAAITQEEMVKDFLQVGIPPEDLRALSSADLIARHRQARHHPELKGAFRDPAKILADVENNARFRRYIPVLKGEAPVTVAVSQQRSERKLGVQPQPAQRTVPPRATAAKPQGNRHTDAARQMAEARGQAIVQ
jgi:hypothetical protein